MPHDPSSPRRARGPLPRRLTGALVVGALALGGAASANDDESPDSLPDPIVFARDGEVLEELLDEAGFGAAWRATSGLGEVTRQLSVTYSNDEAEPATSLVTTMIQLENVITAHDLVVHDLRAVADDLSVAVENERDALIARNRADAHLRGVVALLRAVALQLFEGAYGSDDEILGLDGDAQMTAHRNVELTTHTLDEMIDRRQAAEIALSRAEAALADAVETTAQLRTEHRRLDDEATELSLDRTEHDERARALIPEAASAFALATVNNEPGLTVRALDAYIQAERETTVQQPGCGITWRTIAAVAAVESRHGTYQGRELTLDGESNSPIVGLRLDGSGVDNYGSRLASIPDTDRGRWDGDRNFDRAIGPLQFIPESWTRWARDNDGDGETNPYDIDDAALGTAAYLCNYGSHRSWDTWNAAIFGYNHSVDYVNSVKAAFDRMQRIRVPSPEDGPALRPVSPSGVYVPLPDPEVEEGETGEPPPGVPPQAPPPDPTATTVPVEPPPAEAPTTTAPPAPTTAPPPTTPPTTAAPPSTP